MNVKKNKSGFTLTEILIVLVVAGVLLALILPNSVKAINKGNTVASNANIASCEAAVVMCMGEVTVANRAASCGTVAALTQNGFTKSNIQGITSIDIATGKCQ